MAEEKEDKQPAEPTLVERWLQDQQEWQRTALSYLDSMVKNDDFLVHLGNAMRGSLLAGKPYPTAAAPDQTPNETPDDDRLDRVLFTLHQMQGQIEDLRMAIDEMRRERSAPSGKKSLKAKTPKRKDPG